MFGICCYTIIRGHLCLRDLLFLWGLGKSIVWSFSMNLGDTLGVRFGFLWHSVPWIIVYITFPILQWLVLVWHSWDELFIIVTHCYISISTCSSVFYYTHSSFVLSLFVFFYPHRTSYRFMNDEFFGAHHLSFDVIHLDVGWVTLLTWFYDIWHCL